MYVPSSRTFTKVLRVASRKLFEGAAVANPSMNLTFVALAPPVACALIAPAQQFSTCKLFPVPLGPPTMVG